MRGAESGTTAVEFSLIATLLFMFLFGILHFGLAYNRQQGLHAAAREGARLASLAASVEDADVFERVRTAAPSCVDPDDVVVTITPTGDTSCPAAGDLVTVAVDVNDPSNRYQAFIPGLSAFTPDFSVSATYMCEAARD